MAPTFRQARPVRVAHALWARFPIGTCFEGPRRHTRAKNEAVEERFARLEANLAHLEHLTDQLNGIVVEQGREIDGLKRQLRGLSQTLENIELERIKSTNPKPPHYQ